MITSFIQGGLGNQLFQIAAGLSLAKDLGVEFRLLKDQHHLPMQGTRINNYYSNIFKNINFLQDIDLKNLIVYAEKSFEYKEIPKIDNTALHGYFQSEKYFKHNENYIKEVLNFPHQEFKQGYVSLHFRQGDYRQNTDIHHIQDISYFEKAINYIGDYKKLLIFSDSDLPDHFKFSNMEIIKSNTDLEDLAIMSSCEHNIISNSSFSWWSAWFNKNTSKKIVAPSIWFGPFGSKNWQDIYCEGWRII
jgi:hypothetical protein